jgi:SPP1 gp7 family putative phage head morphogenesis protein
MAGDQAFALAYLSAASASPAVAASLSTAWSRVNTGAVEAMVGRLSDGSPLSEWLSQWGDESAQAIRRELIRGISLGTNPRGIAARLEKQTDIAGARLLTLTRSTVLDTYRTTTLENYRANRDLGAEWEWISAQDARCCLSCLFLDGRRFPLDVRFQPCHLNCRCSSIFVLDGIGTPPRQFASEWFDGQPEATQRQMIPATAWDDFNAGRLTLGDFNVLERDARWGDRYRQSTVSEARANAARRDRMAA